MKDAEFQALSLRNEIVGFLANGVADVTPVIETGGGLGSDDIVVYVGGVCFHIQIHWPKDTKG